MDEGTDSEDNSTEALDLLRKRISELERDNQRLRNQVGDLQEHNKELREENSKLRFELGKSERSDEDASDTIERQVTELQDKIRVNRRHKRIAYIFLSFAIVYLALSYVISSPPGGDLLTAPRASQTIVVIWLIYVQYILQELCVDFKLTEKSAMVKAFINEIEKKALPAWIARAIIGLVGAFLVSYRWSAFKSFFV